ncbi:hypothetical protein [Risungbinella massiliensis]|uniref:hypothetical protein n=1 Tax=Risungbinella massiliensis TaxID=1329796 RepID=UPI0011C9807B|nr:hypothetical protein [Risungbinella massiliensis]
MEKSRGDEMRSSKRMQERIIENIDPEEYPLQMLCDKEIMDHDKERFDWGGFSTIPVDYLKRR